MSLQYWPMSHPSDHIFDPMRRLWVTHGVGVFAHEFLVTLRY